MLERGRSEHPGRRLGLQQRAPTTSLLIIQCGRFRLGVPSRLVRAVVPASEVVPLGANGVEGLLWRDGALLPAVALGPLLGSNHEPERTDVGHGVLVHSERGLICFMVDEALDLMVLPSGSIGRMPPLVIRATGLAGIDSVALLEKLLLVIDPVRLLGPERVDQAVEVATRVGSQGLEGLR